MSALEAGANLRTKLWKTRGSRFAARERLRRTNLLSVTTVTLLSVYVIVSSVILVAFAGQLQPINEKWLNIINIGLSVLVIVFSLIEFSRDYLGWAEAMNQSALKIGSLYNELSVKVDGAAVTQEDVESVEARYNEVLMMHQANHQSMDFAVFKLGNHRDFDDWWLKGALHRGLAGIWFLLQSTWLYLLGIMLFPALAMLWGANLLSLRQLVP